MAASSMPLLQGANWVSCELKPSMQVGPAAQLSVDAAGGTLPDVERQRATAADVLQREQHNELA